jgi:hypothetical protein
VFANRNSKTINNVERIDMIIEGGTYSPDVDLAGFLINERGGNDNIIVAAITSLDSNLEVDGFGSLLSISSSDWASTGKSIATTVFQRDSDDEQMRPSQNLGAQNIASVFVSFSDLGISNDEVIYGFSIFPGDVNSSMDLVGLTDVPLNTPGNGAGGIDLMGGGGFYASESIIVVDLETYIVPSDTAPQNGDVVQMSIFARNNGPQDDFNQINVDIQIPNGFIFQSIDSYTDGTPTYNSANQQISWVLDSGLANQEFEVLVVNVATLQSGDRDFISTISSARTDVSPGNNTRNYELLSKDEQTLPVELLYFKGENFEEYNLLEWATASEVNSDMFILERSRDGVNFEEMTRLKSQGYSFVETYYSYDDYSAENGINYYRLKQVDFDGTSEIFEIISINNESDAKIQVYPNPTDDIINIVNLKPGTSLYLRGNTGRILLSQVSNESSTSFNPKNS